VSVVVKTNGVVKIMRFIFPTAKTKIPVANTKIPTAKTKILNNKFIRFMGYKMELHTLDRNVVSCESAATAKCIPLENELKSLILSTSKGLYLLHIPGNKRADLRSVKKYLGVKQAHLAELNELKSLRAYPGTVNPFSKKMRSLPQLISEELLGNSYLSTNYGGSLRDYVIFKPSLLLNAKKFDTGKFTR